ncbi:N-acetylmuramoyl-L-alanine amidase [candidate division KSB1 bacterium]|nr:N-acetylmuramoyl-L-alanine amidase [candidate division KSB1 bacterium]NIR72830.1 N-acetylmuramoyl-L-alanine amidase [candidate division KSB1 bacterium]NIS26870.1 N-acetylmuramoyl-L-alanine amidase [candidate division KSB1 bacterium]NIT73666.1 N-acetylmuramoyl-L-alanine amidase [candidate division KSB1 bacterium]NIU27537.1 N-acetylmuramoyl-L-alanine amidase [candidate division KSB1 bacterium]
MRGLICTLTIFLIFQTEAVFSQLELDVVYPREEQTVNAFDSTFVFGSTNIPKAKVFVNEIPTRVYPNGAFLGVVPVTSGDFSFRCTAVHDTQSVEVVRKVFVRPFLSTIPRDSFAIDSTYIFPQEDVELLSGDYIHVAFKATPGLMATCTIPGLIAHGPMNETEPWNVFDWGEAVFGNGRASASSPIEGVYTGVFKIPHDTRLDSAEIIFNLKGMDGIHLQATAPGKLTVRNEQIPQIAVLKEELTVARTGPALGYQQFLPEGVKLLITGKHGNYYRARLTDSENLWVPASNLELLPKGTPIPSSRVSLVRTQELENKVKVRVYLQERLPFKIEQVRSPSALKISVYGATSNTDWIRYDFDDPTIKLIKWSQPQSGVYELTVELHHKQQWGFNPYYEDKNLVIEIKKPPEKYEIKCLFICIDPGHGPVDGAIGPTRLKEKNANLQLAMVLKEELEDKGAEVFLTREGQHGASLDVRTKMAAFLEADLLLSIHHNALPDGVDPFTNRGTSTYYYHVQSHPLAVAIQKRLLDELELRNFGLFYDNLALCRPPQMPAVLIESAFIMHPEEEILIKSDEYKEEAAEAIIKGIEDFLDQAKEDR